MTLLANIIWFVLGGFFVGLLYLLGAIILFPLLPFLLPMIGYSFWPFGRRPVSKQAVNAYKQANGQEPDPDDFETAGGLVKFLANIVWLLTFGWMLAISHLLWGLMNLIACLPIITIPICLPNAMAHFKLAPVALTPFGVKIVPTALAEEIDLEHAKAKL